MSSDKRPRDGNSGSPGLPMKPVSLSLGASSALKGQSKKPSFNLQSSARATQSQTQTLARRPHHLHDDDESDNGDEHEPAFESVTGFDTHTGKTISADGVSEKKPLTIPVASNNNWRDRPGVRKPKGKNLLPKEVQALQEAQRKGEVSGNTVESAGPNMSYGLSYARGTQSTSGGASRTDSDQLMKDEEAAAEEKQKPLTEDEIALRALVRESKGEVEGRTDLVIESRQADFEEEIFDAHGNETNTFRADVASRPESATLDQYNAIPVEEFGAALLRGMGWKEGQAVGKGKYSTADPKRATTPHVPARRSGFLGIGAKDSSGGKGAEVELGAWGKAAMRKGARKAGEGKQGEGNTDGVYTPVLMRNTKTGKTITEEELAALKKNNKQDSDDWKERRDRNLEMNGRDRDRDKDRNYRRRENNKDEDGDRYESRKARSSRRDRSRSSSDRHSRRRRYEDDDSDTRDDRYYRERDRERDSDRERRRDNDGDRHRDRDRDRNRDRDRDRKSHKYDDDRYSSRYSSSNASSRHRDRDRDGDTDSHRR